MSTVIVNIDTPVLSYEEFARRTGTTVDNVRYLVRHGRLPCMPKTNARHTPYINMVALHQMAQQAADMTAVTMPNNAK